MVSIFLEALLGIFSLVFLTQMLITAKHHQALAFKLLDMDEAKHLRKEITLREFLEKDSPYFPPRTDHDGLGRGQKKIPESICSIVALESDIREKWRFDCQS